MRSRQRAYTTNGGESGNAAQSLPAPRWALPDFAPFPVTRTGVRVQLSVNLLFF